MAHSKFRLIGLLGILALGVAFFAPTLPKFSYAQTPAPQKIESDDGRVSRDGTWLSQVAPAASGGGYLYNSGEAVLSLNFGGPSLEVIYVSGPSLGTLAIEVDGTVVRTVITTQPETAYGQVAKIDYLTDEAHELKVYAQAGGVVAIDAFSGVSVAEVGGVDLSGRVQPTDRLALIRPDFDSLSLLTSIQDLPGLSAYFSYTTNSPATRPAQWVMGDWDGDGNTSPGVYATNGIFYYTNTVAPAVEWSSIWLGGANMDRPPVAGRFSVAVNHDCIGIVDYGEFPPYGRAFALYFTCDLTDGTAPTISFQWLSVVLPDAGGFSGMYQFAAGDFDNDGIATIAIRRGEFIAFGNAPPTTLLAEFNLAQYWGTPPVIEGTYGTFLAGDFDNANGDSFGVFYENGHFYYRNSTEWNPTGHILQRVGHPLGGSEHATSWH